MRPRFFLSLWFDACQVASASAETNPTFNRLHPQECEGGSVPEEYRIEEYPIESVTDRAQTVATAMTGLT